MKKKRAPPDLATIHLTTSRTAPCAEPTLAALARDLGVAMPAGWRTLMLRAGPGTFDGLVRVHGPDRVREHTAAQQKHGVFTAERSVWDNYADAMDGRAPSDLVALATTLNGDELVLAEGDLPAIYAFPRHSPEIHMFDPKLDDVLAWCVRGGVLVSDPIRFDTYDTHVGQVRVELTCARVDGEDAFFDDLVQTIMEHVAPDHDDGDDPPATFYMRRIEGALHVMNTMGSFIDGKRAPLRLVVTRDEGAEKAWLEIAATLEAEGWRVEPKRAGA